MPEEITGLLEAIEQRVAALAETDPITALIVVGDLERVVRERGPEAAVQARLAGASWSSVGRALGVTKQAAAQRYARHLPPGS